MNTETHLERMKRREQLRKNPYLAARLASLVKDVRVQLKHGGNFAHEAFC